MLTFTLSARFRSVLFLLALCPLSTGFSAATTPAKSDGSRKCLYLSSYHQGYEWSDSIQASIEKTLEGHCELIQIDMDTKRRKSPEDVFAAVNHAIKVIEDWQPDVVITSDDNAAKHVLAPHYRDADLPFVFCGINWTLEEYGLPYSNATGIVEVAPVRTMLETAISISKGDLDKDGNNNEGSRTLRALYIGASTLSEKKNFNRIELETEELNLNITAKFTPHFQHWEKALSSSNNYDFIILGSNAGIEAWDDQRAGKAAISLTKGISVTNHKWMMPYTTLGFTKIASEQGNWAANAAITILNGSIPADIPVASNKKWDLWVNQEILNQTQIDIGRNLSRKAKRINNRTGTASLDY